VTSDQVVTISAFAFLCLVGALALGTSPIQFGAVVLGATIAFIEKAVTRD
jgi:hypothetical protein